jgi:hypothetical protein
MEVEAYCSWMRGDQYVSKYQMEQQDFENIPVLDQH